MKLKWFRRKKNKYAYFDMGGITHEYTMQDVLASKIFLNRLNDMGGIPRLIKIKYHAPIQKIETSKKGDWIDLRAAKTVALKKGESCIIPLGISVQLPDGYEAHIVPRSSTFKKWHIIQTNGVGIIDNSYSGDNDIWGMPVLATEDTVINFDDRICQFRITKRQPDIFFQEVEHLGNTDRGGFGSTGTN